VPAFGCDELRTETRMVMNIKRRNTLCVYHEARFVWQFFLCRHTKKSGFGALCIKTT
jgi:hypothetical protein